MLDAGAALVAELVTDRYQLFLDHFHQPTRFFEDAEQLGDGGQDGAVLIGELFLLQTGEALQAHLQDFLGLDLRQLIAVFKQTLFRRQILRARAIGTRRCQQRPHQTRFPALGQHALTGLVGILARLDQLDHLVDVGQRHGQTFEHVGTRTRLAQIEDRPAGHHFPAMAQEGVEDFLQIQRLRLSAHQGHDIDAEHRLQLGLLVQLVQQHLGVLAALDLDDHAHAVLVGLVAQAIGGDALDFLGLGQLGDLLDQPRLVHLIGQLGDDDRFAIALGFDVGLAAHQNAAAAGTVGLADAVGAVDDARGRKVRPRNVLHQIFDAEVRLGDQRNQRIDHLGQIVRRDIGGHAHRNARRTVDQQVRNHGRHHRWFQLLVVVIGLEIDRILVDVTHQRMRQTRQSHFGVTHRGRRITVDRTKVALTIDQHVAQREGLGHAHHGVVNGGVAMRMVFTDDVTDHAGRFLVGLVVVVAEFLHRVQHAPMHRLQAITDIGQRTPDNDAHRVVQIGLPHLVFDVDAQDLFGQISHAHTPVILSGVCRWFPLPSGLRPATQIHRAASPGL